MSAPLMVLPARQPNPAQPPIEAVRAACASLRCSASLCGCSYHPNVGLPCRSAIAKAAGA